MKSKNSLNNQPTTFVREQYITSTLTSKDGAIIGYRQYGHGPAIVLVQGAMGSAQSFMQLAESLADTFTVYVPDRRGRGLSELPYSKDYSVQRDVEDLDALLAKTGAHFVFGLSSGAIISLQAALTLSTIHKVAIFEPPLFLNGVPADLVPRLDKEIGQDKLSAALITGMKGAQLGPPIFNVMPRFLLELLIGMVMRSEDRQGSGDYIPMRELALTLQYDFQVVAEMSGALERFRKINIEVLLLGGSKGPAYLKEALDALEKVLPHVARVEFSGSAHAAAWNYDKQRNPSGQPELVAKELRQFFVEQQ